MLSRRSLFISTATVLSLGAAGLRTAHAEDWRKQYPEINLGVITDENAADRTARYELARKYLEKALGVKVNWRQATDYAGIIEGVKAKKLEVAYFGPASYAQTYIVTNGQVEPMVEDLDEEGNKGYFSVIVVKKDSPYQTIADLKGKKFAFADPNSTSGHQAPRFFLTKEGYPPDTFFASTVFSGSHENSMIALLNGTVDGAATWYNSDTFSNMQRMEKKGMIQPGQYRIIWKSPRLPSDPWAMPTWLPAEMRHDVKAALLAMPKSDPEAFRKFYSGSTPPGFAEGDQKDYEPVIEMIKANQEQRKSS